MHYNNKTDEESQNLKNFTRLVCVQIFYLISYNEKNKYDDDGNEYESASYSYQELDIETKLREMIGSDFEDLIDMELFQLLLTKTVENYESYSNLIESNLQNWTLERMDLLKVSFIKIFITELSLSSHSVLNTSDAKLFISGYMKIIRLFYQDAKTINFFNAIFSTIINNIINKVVLTKDINNSS